MEGFKRHDTNHNLKKDLCKKSVGRILWMFLLFLKSQQDIRATETSDYASSWGNTGRNLNTGNIPAAGGYSAMSLHGAPLLCLTFEDKAQDNKERWARGKNLSASVTQTSVIQQDKRDDGHFEVWHDLPVDGNQQSPGDWLKRAWLSAGRPVLLVHRGERRRGKNQRFQPIKLLIRWLKILNTESKGSVRLVGDEVEKKWVHTYILPIASHPAVMCAFCRLTWPDDSRTLVSVTKIFSDPSGALQSAVNISVLNADSTGYRALEKQTRHLTVNTQ